MRCSFEGFLTLYATLHKKYLNELVDQNLLKIKKTSKKCSCCNNWLQRLSKGRESWISKNARKSHRKLQSLDFQEIQSCFDVLLNHQAQFLRIYRRLFKLLLLFIRATRQQKQNYAQLTPIYLAEMFAPKDIGSNIWNYFDKGHFCMNKSTVPHSDIGANHAFEHENCAMKVFEEIKGITSNNWLTLEQHFLIMSEINTIDGEFGGTFNIADGGKAFLSLALSLL